MKKQITIELTEKTYNFLEEVATCSYCQTLKSYLEGFLEDRVAGTEALIARQKKAKAELESRLTAPQPGAGGGRCRCEVLPVTGGES